MRKNISMMIALLCMVVQTAWAQFSGGSGTQADPYQISSVSDWNTLATNVNAGESYSGKYFKLTKDIDNIETMVGSKGKPFSGHFFGNGKKLNAAYSESEQVCALFRYVKDATITNLKAHAIIHTTAKFAGGLIGQANGDNFISDCHISSAIWSEVNGDGSHGGLIALVERGDNRIENCLFDGLIDGQTTDRCGGFVGWKETFASITFNNCLFNPIGANVKANGSKTFVRYDGGNLVRINECYFISDVFGFGQGYSRLGFPASDIVNTLGNGWVVSDGNAVPVMNTSNVGCAYITGMKFRYQYTGTPINIDYNVIGADGTLLTNGTDYNAVITLNTVPVASITEDGYYLLTITGKGNYSGTKIVPFYIDKPIDLADINSDFEIRDGETVTGKLNKYNVKIYIADGATVTLAGVTIDPESDFNNKCPGIICRGDATIILADGTENYVRSFYGDCPGIYIPRGKTLIIDGTGALDVAPNEMEGLYWGAAGIGGYHLHGSGNVTIKNGVINAKGRNEAPGIGCGYSDWGDNILIEGGIINAVGGKDCAGIGCGFLGVNGTVTITRGAVVTSVKGPEGTCSIGNGPSNWKGIESKCGTVTIGCTLDADGNPVGGHVGFVTANRFTYFHYTIAFDGNGGSGSMPTQEVDRGFDSNLTLANGFTREGYTFMGWVAENAGTKIFYPEGTSYNKLDVEPNTTITLHAQWIKGEGTADSPYEIASDGDWLTMAHYINNDDNGTYNNKYYKLMADISVTETMDNGVVPVSMIGIGDAHSFKGTFDGNGHTITLNYTDNRLEHYCGPFRIISGATIKNLHVAGTIVKATWKHVGGIAGRALGTNTIINCRSSVDIQVNTDGDCSSGGFIGDLRDGQTTLTGCTFDGKLRGPGGTISRSTKWGGFIGWVADGKKAVLNTCVFAPAEIKIASKSDCRTFARRDDGDDVTLNNCYYLQTLGSAQGKQAYSIVGDEHVSVSFDTAPDDKYNVSGIDSHESGDFIKLNGTMYSAGGKDVYLTLEQIGETPGGYTANTFIATPGSQLTRPQHLAWYLLKMPNSNVTISLLPADWAGSGAESDPYLIYTVGQWQSLVNRVNNGENGGYKDKYFRLMSDITLEETYSGGNPTVMIGTDTKDKNRIDINENTRFRGTFDGNGHTITLKLTDKSGDDYCAPFRFIRNATIKRLHVAGTIVKSGGKYIGGFVGKAEGLNNTISSCRSSVDILSNKDGDASSGGFIGDVRGERVDQSTYTFEDPDWVYPVTTLNNCLFDGKLRGSNANKWGGFVGYAAQYNILYFNSCLFNPSGIEIDINDSDDNSRTFARMYDSDDVTNIHTTECYYLTKLKETQGVHNADGLSNDVLVDGLGTGWNVFGDEVLPIMGAYTFDGKGTQSSPYIIASASDWNGLSSNVSSGENYNGKYIQLGANITVSRAVGRSATNCFKGHFDGAGNKLTFNYTGVKDNIAPFGFVNGATIENLHVDGTINASGSHIAGLIFDAKGKNNIRNCRSSITLNCTATETYESLMWSGFIVKIEEGTTVFTGCVFDGNFLIANGYTSLMSAGFVCHTLSSAEVDVNDCVFDPVGLGVNPQSFTTFVRGSATVGVNNSYYFYVGGNQGKDAIKIIPGEGITMEGNGIVTEYDVSGITGYLTGLKYKDYLYAGSGEKVRLNLDYDVQGYSATGYTVTYLGNTAGTVTGTKSPYILTITNPDIFSVTINATAEKNTLELANAADNNQAIIGAAESGKVYEVTLTDRTLYKDGKWNTLCLPFSLSADQIAANTDFAGATLKTLDVNAKNGFDTTDGTLYLSFKDATEIEAGVPYLVKWESGESISNPVFEGVTISSTEAQAVENTPSVLEPVQMVGTYSPVSVTANDKSILFLSDANTLYYSSTNRELRSCRAYFYVPYIQENPEANVRAFSLRFGDEEATGIKMVNGSGSMVQDDVWYSLDGVRLSGKPTQRGIYLNNGKKIIIK